MTKYKLFIRQYDIMSNDYKVREEIVETNDIYHEIGWIYSNAFAEIKRIDYIEIDEKKELQKRFDNAISALELWGDNWFYNHEKEDRDRIYEVIDILKGNSNEN